MATFQNVGIHEYSHPQYGEQIRQRVGELVEKGRASIAKGIGEVQQEYLNRKDYIVRPQALDVEVNKDGVRAIIAHGTQPIAAPTLDEIIEATQATKTIDEVMAETERKYSLTGHSLQQLFDQSNVNKTFADRLMKLGQFDLLRHNINTLLPVVAEDGLLVRAVGNTVKGILSPSFRRIDASPIFEAFIGSCIRNGFVPYRGINTESRTAFTFVLPQLHLRDNPAGGKPEVILLGLQITTSDYGKGAVSISLVILRVWCANLAAGDSLLRRVHLGSRFDAGEESIVELSRKTVELDSATVASACDDVVGSFAKHADKATAAIETAINTNVKIDDAIASLKKRGLGKEILDQAKTLFVSETPVEILPPGSNAWRLSNVLSFLANTAEGDAKIDLQNEAYRQLAA